MHKQKISITVSAIIGIIAVFLPFVSALFVEVTLIEMKNYTGYIVIVLFIIPIILSIIGDSTKRISKDLLIGGIISGILPGVLMILYAVDLSNNKISSHFSSLNIGFYLVIFSSMAILILGSLFNDSNDYKSKTEPHKYNKQYCSNCGKLHNSKDIGSYCDECGIKL